MLGIREPQQLRTHPLRGAIFKSWVVSEIHKGMVHRGHQPSLFHYRETRDTEVDLLMEQGRELTAIEIKSGQTVVADFFVNLRRFAERLQDAVPPRTVDCFLVYGGDSSRYRTNPSVLSWREVDRLGGKQVEE